MIHPQGRAARWSSHQAVERVADQVRWLDYHVARARFGRAEAVWCSLRHPSRNWAQPGRAYLRDVAEPARRAARAVAMGG